MSVESSYAFCIFLRTFHEGYGPFLRSIFACGVVKE